MRHLMILLLCVSTCLMAAAGVPQLKRSNFSFTPDRQSKVYMQNRLMNHFNFNPGNQDQDFSPRAQNSLQRQRLNPDNLVNKRAPRRLSDDDMISKPTVCFLYAYDIMGDEPVPADPFYASGGAYWYPDTSNGLYFAGFYWNADGSTYYLPLDIDYSTGEVALSWGILLEDDSVIGNARNRTDTVWYEILVSQDYWENEEQNDCMGTIYSDGSIVFDDNYVYYSYKELRTIRNGRLQSTDTLETATMFVGTEILTANGELTYIREQDGRSETAPVFMYQVQDTLFVGNLWNYGVPNSYMVLNIDSTVTYPCYEYDPEDGVYYMSNPIWDVPDSWIDGGLGMFYPVSSYTLDDQGYIADFNWGIEGNATPDQITWDYTMLCNGYHCLYGFENNVLRYTDGNQFVIPTEPVLPLRGDLNDDGQVDLKDIIALRDALLLQDWDSFNFDNADCNLDGTVDYSDRQPLIDYILNGTWPE